MSRARKKRRNRLVGALAAVALLLLLLLLRPVLFPPTTQNGTPSNVAWRHGGSSDGAPDSRGEGATGGKNGDHGSGSGRGHRAALYGEGSGVRGGGSADGTGSSGVFPRRGAGRPGRRLVATKGGGSTETSVDRGLDWLADHQDEDGSWNPARLRNRRTGVRTDGGGQSAHRTGVTGLALMTFLGAGETYKTGKYRTSVKAALDYLRKAQDRDGRFVPADAEEALLGHVWAMQALGEACAFSGSSLFKPALRKATEHLIDARTDDGGWPRAEKSRETDTALTIWALLALFAAKETNPALVPDDVVEDALGWLCTVTDGRSGLVASTRHSRYVFDRDLWLTAGGALARTLITDSNGSDALRMAAEQCLRRLPVHEAGRIDIPLWHLGTYALFQRDGDTWWTWNAAMKKAVIDSQRREGDERGSWDPLGPWAGQGGRVWSTAMLQMCLQVYYRYSRVPSR